VGGPLQRIPSSDEFLVDVSEASETMVAQLARGQQQQQQQQQLESLAGNTSVLLRWAGEQIAGAQDSVEAAAKVLGQLRQVGRGAGGAAGGRGGYGRPAAAAAAAAAACLRRCCWGRHCIDPCARLG
jgi:hypothetical protein